MNEIQFINHRFKHIQRLKEGWYNGEGKEFDAYRLEVLDRVFSQNYNLSLDLPATFPTPDGKIQYEWSFKHYELSITVDIHTLKADFQLVSCTQADFDEEIDLTLKESCLKLLLFPIVFSSTSKNV